MSLQVTIRWNSEFQPDTEQWWLSDWANVDGLNEVL
jgi:hypothetical protein